MIKLGLYCLYTTQLYKDTTTSTSWSNSTLQTNTEDILQTQHSIKSLLFFSTDKQQHLIHNSNVFQKLTSTFFFILKTISKYWTCWEHSLIILRLSFNCWFPLWIQVHVLLWWQSTRIMLRLVYRLTHRSYIIFKVNKDENILYF